jgi:hypothetical protein
VHQRLRGADDAKPMFSSDLLTLLEKAFRRMKVKNSINRESMEFFLDSFAKLGHPVSIKFD